MNGFNDLKEKLEAQGIAVNSSTNSDFGKNGSNSNSATNSNSNANSKNKAKNAELESIAEKERRLRSEFIDFAKDEDTLK